MTSNNTTMKALLPFQGFYNTAHDDAIDSCAVFMFTDENDAFDQHGHSVYLSEIDWQSVRKGYAKYYTNQFADEFSIESLYFMELDTSRFYNYETDVIIATLSFKDFCVIWNGLDKVAFGKLCIEKFTSRDGFISHYDPDWEKWGLLSSWDEIQIGTALEAYATQESNGNFDEIALMDEPIANGMLDELLG